MSKVLEIIPLGGIGKVARASRPCFFLTFTRKMRVPQHGRPARVFFLLSRARCACHSTGVPPVFFSYFHAQDARATARASRPCFFLSFTRMMRVPQHGRPARVFFFLSRARCACHSTGVPPVFFSYFHAQDARATARASRPCFFLTFTRKMRVPQHGRPARVFFLLSRARCACHSTGVPPVFFSYFHAQAARATARASRPCFFLTFTRKLRVPQHGRPARVFFLLSRASCAC